MQKYKVNPIKEIDIKNFNFRELYIAPDMTFISGVTDYSTGLVDGEQVMVTSYTKDAYGDYIKDKTILTVKVEEVERQGKISVKIVLPVKTITQTVNLPVYDDGDGFYTFVNNKKTPLSENIMLNQGNYAYIQSAVTQNYVVYNGNISYFFNGDYTGYLVDKQFYHASFDDDKVEINSYVYIEDNKFTIGEYTYRVSLNGDEIPDIKRSKYSPSIKNGSVLGAIGENVYKVNAIDGNYIFDYQPSRWYKVQKFTIGNVDVPRIEIEEVLAGGYAHFIDYNGESYELSAITSNLTDRAGYGVIIDDESYFMNYDAIDDEYNPIFSTYHDLFVGPEAADVRHESGDEEYPSFKVTSVERANTNGGRFLFLIAKSDDLPFIEGNSFIAESLYPIPKRVMVDEDANGNKYILHNSKRYDVHDHLYDTVLIAGSEFKLEYDTKYSVAHTSLPNGDVAYFNISKNIAKLKNRVYFLKDDSVLYGTHEGYEVITHSGVTINGRDYEIKTDEYSKIESVDENGNELDEPIVNVYGTIEYVELEELSTYELTISEVRGSSTYICYPEINRDLVTITEEDFMMREIVSEIVTNKDAFVFKTKKKTFGEYELNPENSLLESMTSTSPVSVNDRQVIYDTIKIGKLFSHLLVQFPIASNITNNLMAEDILHNKFVDYIKDNSYNSIVDMEKDVYYPVYNNTNDICVNNTSQITEVRFNLHFRTRNLDNWKIYDDSTIENEKFSNWFVTDYKLYSETDKGNKNYVVNKKSLQNASDLLGLMNFTTSEVKNQAKKISRSFLRISFYSTDDPETQVLLGTSVIYLDERKLLKKFLSSKESAMLSFCDVEEYQVNGDWSKTGIDAKSEAVGNSGLNDDLRLSSRLVVKDKYNTDASSEGFYMYLFKEYSRFGRTTTIYARFEFNHAGIGKTIPMMIPRRFKNEKGEKLDNPEILYLHKEDDVKKLKDGFLMEDIYKQLHFPIEIKFDDTNNKYVYWINPNLRENGELGVPNDIMEFNLFEIKFKDESYKD